MSHEREAPPGIRLVEKSERSTLEEDVGNLRRCPPVSLQCGDEVWVVGELLREDDCEGVGAVRGEALCGEGSESVSGEVARV